MTCLQLRKAYAIAFLLSIILICEASADWWQFQGPDRNGISPETGLSRSWPESGPKELWSFPLGEGFAGPAVRDGEVYILDRQEDKRDILRCLDLATGKERWNMPTTPRGLLGIAVPATRQP